MKKAFCLIFILCTIFSFSTYASTLSDENQTTIEPKASYVFDSVGSSVSKSSYSGSALLVDPGKATVTITLQKYASASNTWVPLAGPYSQTFYNTTIPGFSKSKILSTKGKYRCKTTVNATVGSHTDTRTVYSGTLTIN